MIAVLEARKAGLLALQQWPRNLVAGLIVGVVALPLAMAFGIASGVKPEQGIYSAVIAGGIVSLFGGSRIQIAGPTGAFVVILAGITRKYGVDGLLLSTFMAGIMLILFGLSRLGGVIRFIPDPVISGFTAGIGVIIWVGQWQDFFGLPKVQGDHFYEKTWHLLRALPQLHFPTTVLALISLVLVLYGPRLPGMKRVPGPLIAMVVCTAAQSVFAFNGIATIGTAFGGIQSGLPHLSMPAVSLDKIEVLFPAAFTIALLGAIESLLSAVVADGMAGTRHNANQELIGQGIANVVAPLFGGIAATGAIARTATNFRNGGNSPIAGIMHSVVLVFVLLLLAPLAAHIPLCSLSAILFLVAWNMSNTKHFLRLTRIAPRADVVILIVTFTLTVFTDLVIAVNIGVLLALLQFLRRMAGSVEVITVDEDSICRECGFNPPPASLENVMVLSIEGPLFFGAVENLERALDQTFTNPYALVFRLNRVPFMDITGIQALANAMHTLESRGVKVFLTEANPRVRKKLSKADLLPLPGASNRYFETLSAALAVATTHFSQDAHD